MAAEAAAAADDLDENSPLPSSERAQVGGGDWSRFERLLFLEDTRDDRVRCGRCVRRRVIGLRVGGRDKKGHGTGAPVRILDGEDAQAATAKALGVAEAALLLEMASDRTAAKFRLSCIRCLKVVTSAVGE